MTRHSILELNIELNSMSPTREVKINWYTTPGKKNHLLFLHAIIIDKSHTVDLQASSIWCR